MLHRSHLTLVLLFVVATLGLSSPVAAQTPPIAAPTGARGFSVALPAFVAYVAQHGRERTFGSPISNDFQLLGRRVQLFDNQVLQAQPDGSVRAMDLLLDALPLAHVDGVTFPAADPDMLAATPPTDSPDYMGQAMAAISAGALDTAAPDQWNDLPVNFGATFRSSVTCADLVQPGVCDADRLMQLALDVWGLPTSAVTADPNNPDLISLRFQRGIMQYSASSGLTQAVPIGRWFKQVVIGVGLPDDLRADVAGSPFYGQYRPTAPLGVARPSELTATSMTSAFSVAPGGLAIATTSTDPSPTPTVGPALSTFGPGLPTFGAGTTVASQPFASPTPTVVTTPGSTPSIDPGLTGVAPGTPVSSGIASGVAIPTTPMGPDPCVGDEQIMFAPGKPYVGTDVLVAATSSHHHDVRTVRLSGPVKSGPVNERQGLNGWVWEWTISPPIDGWYSFTFFADGARPCATSGFNALPAFGATPAPSATPTAAPFSTATALPTSIASPTSTPLPAPTLAATSPADPASGACAGRLLRLNGANFGQTQAALNGNVLFAGTTGTSVATILSWTNSTILLTVPSGLAGGSQQIVVTTSAGASTPISYQMTGC